MNALRLVLCLCCWLLGTVAAQAQTAPPAPAPAPARSLLPIPALPAPAAAPDPAAQRAQLDALIQTLQDDQARARLLDQLKGLSQAPPPADDSLSPFFDRLQDEAASRAAAAVSALVDFATSVEAVPELAGWIGRQLSDEVSRVIWWTVLSQTGLAVALGLAASMLVRVILRGWRGDRMLLPPVPSLARRLRVAGARLFVDYTALLGFLAVTYAALKLLNVTFLARIVAMDVLGGVMLGRMLTGAARALLATDQPSARLLPLTDRQAGLVGRWITVLCGVAIYANAALAAALRLGLPWTVHAFLQHALFLAATVLVLIAIFRIRQHVAAILRGFGQSGDAWLRRLVPWEPWAVAGPYVLAAWVVLQYLVWALRIPQGSAILTRGTVGTLLALGFLRVISVSLGRLLQRPARPAGEEPLATEEPEPAPVSAAQIAAVAALRALAVLLAAAVVLQAWGVDITDWLGTSTGRDILGRVLGVLTVATLAGLAWYAVDKTAQRYITAQDAEGNLIHNNRTRTLANIVRNLALTVALFVVIGHFLTELGVNTAAILAGAGVVGFAIGFGSQKLVQDLTTGLFILLGDTVRVGDVVQLGDRGGVVEAVSMRTVTLRDYNGQVHTIPYSSISIVTNMTKDYAFAVFNVTVGYNEDVDRVMDVLREIDSQLRREWPYRRIMLEPLDMAGVDAFTERGVVIVARSRTRAGDQWKVQREFNRRMKRRFDELGIGFPYPQQTVHIAESPREPPPRPFQRPEVVRAEARGADR